MKSDRRDSAIFSLSFLDVICCGFGAMVLLVLLSKNNVAGGALNTEKIKNLLGNITVEKERKTAGEQARAQLLDQTSSLEEKIRELDAPNLNLAGLKQRLAEERAKANILQIKTNAPVLKETPDKAATDEVVKVGGIPVDSEYIIFIVDTSGSMKAMWSRVITELENVISIHPKVKGFQIMNDNGVYLIKSYAGKWIPDTPGRRKSVLSAMKNWVSFSNSSPVEGLERALKTYAKHTENLAIYIFGDDYTGSSYDLVLDTISRLNLDPKTGEPLAQIHGIGFLQDGVADRFATLMREVARRNRGAFVALGLNHRSRIVEAIQSNRN